MITDMILYVILTLITIYIRQKLINNSLKAYGELEFKINELNHDTKKELWLIILTLIGSLFCVFIISFYNNKRDLYKLNLTKQIFKYRII